MSSQSSWLRTLAAFGFFWGCIGYALGTLTLLGPVRWVTQALRSAEAGDGFERLVVLAIIGALAVVSGAAAFFCARRTLSANSSTERWGLPAGALAAAGLCVWVWMTPSLMRGDVAEVTIASGATDSHPTASVDRSPVPTTTTRAQPEESTSTASSGSSTSGARAASAPTHFTFGPYPEEARLRELQQDGYDGVVALLHPAVVPFEPKLLAKEKRAAERVGIPLHHFPMLPWVGDNAESLEELRALASEPGRYYVHCYLGRDRVRMAQAVVARAIRDREAVTIAADLKPKPTIAERLQFERGAVVPLADDAFLSPFPTDEEFAARVVSAEWGSIVSLLDPGVPGNRKWIAKEREILQRYGMELIERPISVERYDAAAVLATVREVRGLPRPLLVHDFLAADSGKSPAAEAFLAAWRTDLPPVPPSLFDAQVLAANVVVGPRPEFSRVGRRGISKILYVGASAPATDRSEAEAAGLGFTAVDPSGTPDWADRLAQDGPWYVYGVDAEIVGRRLNPQGGA